MTSIYDIPYKDIKMFLLTNNKNINNKDIDYKQVLTLLKNKESKGHTKSIIEWMIAHNLLIKLIYRFIVLKKLIICHKMKLINYLNY